MLMSIEDAAIKSSFDVQFIKKLCIKRRVAYATNKLSIVVEYDDIAWHKRQTVLRSRTLKQLNNTRKIRDIESLGFDIKHTTVSRYIKVPRTAKRVDYE